jgi:peptide deformylase
MVSPSQRIFVVRYDRLTPGPIDASLPADVGIYINPEFVKASRRRLEMDEGCLSVRGIYGKTIRHERATVRARLPDGSTFMRGGGGILAQVFQHETDHLDGILFIDHAHEQFEPKREPDAKTDGVPQVTHTSHED